MSTAKVVQHQLDFGTEILSNPKTQTITDRLMSCGLRPLMDGKEIIRLEAPLDIVSSPSIYIEDLKNALKITRQNARVDRENGEITEKQKLGAVSSSKGAINHLGDYPSALSFLLYSSERITHAVKYLNGATDYSIPIALAYSVPSVMNVFKELSSGTDFEKLLDQKPINKANACKSYIEAAVVDPNKPLHPISRTVSKVLEAIKNDGPQKILIIFPKDISDEHAKLLTIEIKLIKQLIGPDKKIKVTVLSHDEAAKNHPYYKRVDKKVFSVVIHGTVSNELFDSELSSSRFGGAEIVSFRDPDNFVFDKLFEMNERNPFNHGSTYIPRKRRK